MPEKTDTHVYPEAADTVENRVDGENGGGVRGAEPTDEAQQLSCCEAVTPQACVFDREMSANDRAGMLFAIAKFVFVSSHSIQQSTEPSLKRAQVVC